MKSKCFLILGILLLVSSSTMAMLSCFYNSSGDPVVWFDEDGNLIIPNGTLTEGNSSWPTNFEGFKVCNTSSNKIATIETSTGNVKIAGTCYEDQSSLIPSNAQWNVRDGNGDTVAYFDNMGDLYLKGVVRGVLYTEPRSLEITVQRMQSTIASVTLHNDGDVAYNFTASIQEVVEQLGGEGGEYDGLEGYAYGKDTQVVGAEEKFENGTAKRLKPLKYDPEKIIVKFKSEKKQFDEEENNFRNQKNKALLKRKRIHDRSERLRATLGESEITYSSDIVPDLHVVRLQKKQSVELAIQQLNQRDDIEYAEPDYIREADATTPNDFWYNYQWSYRWGLQRIEAPLAWDIATNASSIIVAVIDSGVDYNHVDLAANMWKNQAEFNGQTGVDDDGNGYIDDIYGYDFRNNDNNPMDDQGHGTHCAGIIGAVGNNSIGVAGVCWNVKIMALKFLNSSNSGSDSDAIECIDYAIVKGAKILNCSWGGTGYHQGLSDAIVAASQAGILVITAAGNDNVNTDYYPHYPSCYMHSNIISVMATQRDDDQKATYSNYGRATVDLAAPGSYILSCYPNNNYYSTSGTSMAAPYVAGTAALVWSLNTDLTYLDIKNIILSSVDKDTDLVTDYALDEKCVTEGRLNLYKTLQMNQNQNPAFEVTPSSGTVNANSSTNLTVNFDTSNMQNGTYNFELKIELNDPDATILIVPVILHVESTIEITSISPASVSPEGKIRITGTGFYHLPEESTVTFGSYQGTILSVPSGNCMIVEAPVPSGTGNYSCSVQISSGTNTSNTVSTTIKKLYQVHFTVNPSYKPDKGIFIVCGFGEYGNNWQFPTNGWPPYVNYNWEQYLTLSWVYNYKPDGYAHNQIKVHNPYTSYNGCYYSIEGLFNNTSYSDSWFPSNYAYRTISFSVGSSYYGEEDSGCYVVDSQ